LNKAVGRRFRSEEGNLTRVTLARVRTFLYS